MEIGIVDLVSFDHGFAWRHWAVWYFLLVGSAVGASLIAFIAACRDEGAPEVRPALFAAALCGIAAPFPLLADIHQPARFMHFYLSAATDSVMWWGAWFLPAFVGGLAVLVFLHSPYGKRFVDFRKYAWYWTAAFAVSVLAYTAGEMTIVRARPIWHNAFFPVMLSISAIVSGAGIVSVVAAVRGEKSGIAPRVMAIGSLLFVAGILTWIVFGLGRSVDNGGAFTELAVQDKPASILLLMVIVCGFGGAMVAFIRPRDAVMNVLAGLLAVLGALIFRWQLFMGGQAQPKTEAGFLPYSLFANSDALAGLVGTVGLLVVTVAALSFVLVDKDGAGEDHAASHTAHTAL